ncbi:MULTISPECIES: DUF4105 domain-containing protein [unclassified Psychrobacter]|uniref:Lnb N-terminal periplasmic domain-containing protein n=1 Tax=unclassified Psychrobacter TaxID=196806 RepID=UPI0018F407EC|nr:MULTISPECIES: DUF4105 domain-containing protein [unclassified Psychrobacter]
MRLITPLFVPSVSRYTRLSFVLAISAVSIPLYNAKANVDTDSLAPTSISAAATTSNTATTDMSAQPVSAELATWRAQVREQRLYERTTWRRLLYFVDKGDIAAKKAKESAVDKASFYLTQDGQHNPAAEMDALLVAIAAHYPKIQNTRTPITLPDDDALCRFPARARWLSAELGLDDVYISVHCKKLDNWTDKLAAKQLSVMFAEEYLDNPMSAFAHTLLRIDSQTTGTPEHNIRHAYALNDTVDGDAADSFVIYAIKSISGIYNNVIEIDPYSEKLAKYVHDDERDVWTYRLALTPAEVEQIMYHVWETKDLALPYYFTTDNCASEILRLIDVVRPQNTLLQQLPYAVVPAEVITLLQDYQLLDDQSYTPSAATRRQALQNKATENDVPLDKDMLNKAINADDVQTLLPDDTLVASDNNPLTRHPLQMASIGVGQAGGDSYTEVGIRAGYHDRLDKASGFPQFFDLGGLEARVRFNETDTDRDNDRVELQQATLIRGRSFNPLNTSHAGSSWGINIQATRVNDGADPEGRDHLVGSLGYERGVSWAFGTPRAGTGEMPPQLCYGLASATGQVGRGISKGYRVGAGVHLGCDYQINNRLRAQAQLQLPYWYHGNSDAAGYRGHYWQPITMLGVQYDIDAKNAIRLEANYEWQERIEKGDDVQLSYRRYF